MRPLVLAALVCAALAIAYVLTRPRPEIPAHWSEPDDGFAPGELPQADPRVNALSTYLRSWQNGQPVYIRVGKWWLH